MNKYLITLTAIIAITLSIGIHSLSYASFTEALENLGRNTGLPNFTGTSAHPDAPREAGVRSIASSILYVVDFLKYLLGSIAVAMIIFSAMKLIIATDNIDDQISKQKNSILYASLGLVVIIIADEVVEKVIYGTGGREGTTLQDLDTAISYAIEGAKNIRGFYNFLEFFAAAIAMLILVYNGIRLIVESSAQETLETRKKHIKYALIGLVIIGLSELFIKDIIFPLQPAESGSLITLGQQAIPEPKINYQLAITTIGHLINFIASFIGYLAIAAIVYAGYLYVTARGEDDQISKAKKVLVGALIGILLAALAFALVSTIIPLEGRTKDEIETSLFD